MAIREWPESERPRERLEALGASALSDSELLAVLLRSGSAGRSAVSLARALLHRFGSLRGLLAAMPSDLVKERGIGPARVCELQALAEIARRAEVEPLVRGAVIGDPESLRRWLRLRLRDLKHEIFAVLLLDARHQVIRFQTLFRGTLDGASVHPREVVRAALSDGAAAVIVVHNHPSGVAEPSRADVRITARLKAGLELVDVRLLDHLVVGDQVVISLAERGLL
jgi:DNA repair protein RadC